MCFTYSIYGLKVRSNIPIPGLLPESDSYKADVIVNLGEMPKWANGLEPAGEEWNSSPSKDDNGNPVLLTWKLDGGTYIRLRYGDGTTFIVDRQGTVIWAVWGQLLTLEDTAVYLLGPILGFVLHLRGITCLHAGAVAIKDRAVIIIGVAGAGKSTTTASFAKLGFPILTDDVAALAEKDGHILIQPGYPVNRLWPDSVEMLFGAPDALPLMTPNWDKRYLDLTNRKYQFQRAPLPLGAIYFLDKRVNDPNAPMIEPVTPLNGLLKLITNVYTYYLLEKEMRERHFELLGRLAKHMPLRKVTPHKDPKLLTELCQSILVDYCNLNISP
ncbi:MAG: serine/threonine protein kinase [Acidobacteriota bacterium]|nr:MAG: serine/threonine protein kinase [Acidobacteriota bacterium]